MRVNLVFNYVLISRKIINIVICVYDLSIIEIILYCYLFAKSLLRDLSINSISLISRLIDDINSLSN